MSELAQQFAAFRAAHPLTRRTLCGHTWEHIVCGAGPETLLLLPGGFGVAETSFQYVLAFEQNRRVISVTYPQDATTAAELVAGVVALLNAEDVAAAHVLGGSASGLIAQILVRQHPERVASLILSHTGVPRPARASQAEWCEWLAALLPLPLLRMLLLLFRYSFLPKPGKVHDFWRGHFAAVIASTSVAGVRGRFQIAAGIDRNVRLAANDLDHWPGHVLIIESAHDALIGPAERAALRALYPRAEVHTFNSAHSAAIDRPEEQIALIAAFLG